MTIKELFLVQILPMLVSTARWHRGPRVSFLHFYLLRIKNDNYSTTFEEKTNTFGILGIFITFLCLTKIKKQLIF